MAWFDNDNRVINKILLDEADLEPTYKLRYSNSTGKWWASIETIDTTDLDVQFSGRSPEMANSELADYLRTIRKFK